MSGVRSMDMNHNANATGKVRNGKRTNRRATSPAARPNLHKEPSSLHPLVVVPVGARILLRPHPRHPLEAVDSQRRHPDRQGEEEAARDPEPLADPKVMPCETEAEGINDRDQEKSGSAEALPGAVDEPTHRRHDDECAEVVGDVGEVEAGATPSSAFERGPEGLNLGCRDQPLSVSPFDV